MLRVLLQGQLQRDDDTLLTYLSVLILGRHLDTRDRLPEPTQEPPEGMQAMHLRRAQPSPPLRRTPLRTPPHQRSRGALHPVSCWHRLAHLQSFLDTIHTAAAVYVFSALLPPPSCPQKVNQNFTHDLRYAPLYLGVKTVACAASYSAAPELRQWSPTAPG